MTAQTILPANSTTGGFEVSNSLRFNVASTDYLALTPGSAGNTKLWTWSAWFKKSVTGADMGLFGQFVDANNGFRIKFRDDDRLQVDNYASGSATMNLILTQQLKDPAAWYHLVVAYDSAQSTASNTVKIYINGTRVTALNTETYPSQNVVTTLPIDGSPMELGRTTQSSNDPQYFGGYFSEVVLVDGQALDSTSFGEFDEDSGIWKPINVNTLTYGTNGFHLEFKGSGTGTNASGMGADTSGNDDHFAVNNLTAVDQSTDTCTNNFATMNSLAVPPANAPTFTEGNLKISTNNANANPVLSTIGVSQGKWYVECKRISFDSGSADDGFRIGFGTTHVENVNLVPPGISNSGHYFMIGNGTVYNGSTDLGDKDGDSNISDDGVVGIALDLDNNRISWSFDGVWMTGSNAWSGSSPSSYVDIASGYTYFFLQTDGSTGRGYTAGWNFGGTSAFAISSGNADANGHGNFEFAPPSGYFALCTKNLAEYGG